jgi:hypothetical protein
MRLARVTSVEQANEFLKNDLPTYNRRFKVKPASESDVHQPALSMRALDKIFCIRDERTLRNDFTIAYNGKLYQIKDAVKAQMEETQKSIATTSRCFLKADISILVRIGHYLLWVDTTLLKSLTSSSVKYIFVSKYTTKGAEYQSKPWGAVHSNSLRKRY